MPHFVKVGDEMGSRNLNRIVSKSQTAVTGRCSLPLMGPKLVVALAPHQPAWMTAEEFTHATRPSPIWPAISEAARSLAFEVVD